MSVHVDCTYRVNCIDTVPVIYLCLGQMYTCMYRRRRNKEKTNFRELYYTYFNTKMITQGSTNYYINNETATIEQMVPFHPSGRSTLTDQRCRW